MRNLLHDWNPEPETITVEEPCDFITSGVGVNIHYETILMDGHADSNNDEDTESGIGSNTYTTTSPP